MSKESLIQQIQDTFNSVSSPDKSDPFFHLRGFRSTTAPIIEKLIVQIETLALFIKSQKLRELVLSKLQMAPPPHLERPSEYFGFLISYLERLKSTFEIAVEGIKEDGGYPADTESHPEMQKIDKKRVFVVHGRNKNARDGIFQFLRTIALQPIEWSEARVLTKTPSPYIGDILDAAFGYAQAFLILMTPDDEAKIKDSFLEESDPPYEKELTGQARPNVLFEAGMAFGKHPDRTILVEAGQCKQFSDISGKMAIRWDNSTMRRQELANALATAGCEINLKGTDWHTAGEIDLH